MFKAEQEACGASLDAIDWESEALATAFKKFRCPHCSSSLLRNDKANAKRSPDLVLTHSKCGEDAD